MNKQYFIHGPRESATVSGSTTSEFAQLFLMIVQEWLPRRPGLFISCFVEKVVK